MRGKQTAFSVCVWVVLGASLAQACLWDWDTLQMERRRFPGVLEMITGKFVRHSPAYYQWRIVDRTERLKSSPADPALTDDLAVALSKLGRHEEGIALLEQFLEKLPERYETLANLGTLHMLAGDLERGKEYIDRAIVVNPDAHFGREKYQSLLAEYWVKMRKGVAAADQEFSVRLKNRVGFAKFVLETRFPRRSDERSGDDTEAERKEIAAALKGVLGMMHFANHDSPMLLEALGDLLIADPSFREDALHLAARAYFRAAQVSDADDVKEQYKEAARKMTEGSVDYIDWRHEQRKGKPESAPPPDDLDKLAGDFEKDLASARNHFAAVEADEKQWIARGKNVDEAFAAKYYTSLDSTIAEAQRQLAKEPRDVRTGPHDDALRAIWILAGVVCGGPLALLFAGYCGYRIWRSRRLVNPARN